MAETNVELVRRGFEAALRGDLDVIGALLADDVKWHGGDVTSGCQNRGEALRVMHQAKARLADVELVDVVGGGDKVVVIIRPPSQGDEPAAPVANLTTFRDGKGIEMVHYPSPDDALTAAGGKADHA